jgi:hypothetical protein
MPSVSRLFRKCGILDISKLYSPPRSVTGTSSFYLYLQNWRVGVLEGERIRHDAGSITYIPPKRLLILSALQAVIDHEIEFFITTALNTYHVSFIIFDTAS